MKTIEGLIQGSPEWVAHRATTRNASDAPVMMGVSPYKTRAELVREYATGIRPEVTEQAQRLFDRGHAVEPALRAYAENETGEDLYPITGVSDDGYLGASFDGVTMLEDCIFEGKLANKAKIEAVRAGSIPECDYWQVVHQFAVCDSAETCLYVCGDGTPEGTAHVLVPRAEVADDIPRLIAAWKQFDADVAAYVPEEAAPVVVAKATDSLPAVSVRMDGEIAVISNLDLFGQQLHAFVGAVNTEPNDDQGFADAEAAVKTLKKAEEALTQAEAQALAQIDPVEAMRRQVADLHETARSTRLLLEKVVKTRKEQIKAEVVQKGVADVRAHYADLNKGLGAHAISMPANVATDIGASIKGLKTIDSVRDAVGTAVANAKVAASEHAALVSANVAILSEHREHDHLFADRVSLCESKSADDLRNLIAARIAEHQQREQARLDAERARIRAEEEARAQREADAKARQEADDRRRLEARASLERAEQSLNDPRPQRQAAQPSPGHISEGGGAAPMPPAKKARPADAEIIGALSLHYRVHESKVIEWLLDMNLEAASSEMMKEFAA